MSNLNHRGRMPWAGAALSLLLAGCGPSFYQPNPYYGSTPMSPGYPTTQPVPGYPVTSIPGNSPSPTGPVVSNPSYPSIPATPTGPSTPSVPVSTPTNNPVPIPSNPSTPSTNPSPAGDIMAQWAPWPLPPQTGAAIALTPSSSPVRITQTSQKPNRGHRHPRSVATRPGSHSERISRSRAAVTGNAQDSNQLIDGANPTPAEDLHYRGGRTFQSMGFVNLYISGEQGWKMSDVNNIDHAISAAMNDQNLNNVIRQYFNNQTIGTTVYPSHPLNGYLPKEVSRGDVQYFIQYLYSKGYLSQFDLTNTVFCFLCPPGSVLTDEDARSGSASTASAAVKTRAEDEHASPLPIGMPEDEAEVDSIGGLGGYHGSLHIGNTTIYYAAIVYSESRPDGFKNGIPAFSDSWKNVVATMYHELQEARTDPDVEDVIRNPYSPGIEKMLGWTSDAGEEIGDFPLHDNVSIRQIIQEVPLADGSGTVPIQLEYSNAVHGPEGPIPQPHATPAR